MEEHQVASATAANAMKAEVEYLQKRCDHIQTQARIWKMEARAQQSITKDIGILLGGIPDHGPLVHAVDRLVAEHRQREYMGFSHDIYERAATLRGVKFAECFFENLHVSRGEDECYSHVRAENGVLTITRHRGHRRMIAILTGAVKQLRDLIVKIGAEDPSPGSARKTAELTDTLDALLTAIDREIPEEALRVEAVLQRVREFRQACHSGLTETELKQAEHDQLAAAGALFAELELLDLLRDRLIETGKPVAEKP